MSCCLCFWSKVYSLAVSGGCNGQIQVAFDGIDAFNAFVLQNNHTLPQLLPAMFGEVVDMAEVDDWLQTARSAIEAAAGGVVVVSTLDAFIANSRALIMADLAFFAANQQVASVNAQVCARTWCWPAVIVSLAVLR